MKLKSIVAQYSSKLLNVNTVNSNGTTWLCSNDDMHVLVEDHSVEPNKTLSEIHAESDILQINVGGRTIY